MIEYRGYKIQLLNDGRYKVEVDIAGYVSRDLESVKEFIDTMIGVA